MKRAWLAFGSVALLSLAACGSNGLKTGDAGATKDMSAPQPDQSMPVGDMPPPVVFDLAGLDFKGVSCGQMTCGASQTCCVAASAQGVAQMCVDGDSCGDGGITASCDGPEDCSGGTPSCCADISVGGGTPSGGAMCTSTCMASASAGGGGGAMIETKLCHSPADCTNYAGSTPLGTLDFDSCCTYTGVAYRFCAPGIITGFDQNITCN
jgi:hypothetical protein